MKKQKYQITEKDFKIVSPEEALWTTVRDSTKQRVKGLEESIVIEKALLELAETKILEAQHGFKKE